MRELTIAFSCYSQPAMLAKWFESFYANERDIRDLVEVVVIDDCGKQAAVTNANQGVRIFRITEDIPWNQPGARNLAAHVATTPRLMLIDVDMTLPAGMLGKLVKASKELKPGRVLRPALKCVGSQKLDHTSPNVHLLLREDFLKIGYDESYAGHKGWSDVQLLRVMQRAFELVNRSDLWFDFHHGNAEIPDAQVMTLDRSTAHNKKLHLKRMGQLGKMEWKTFVAKVQRKPIQFPWIQVQ